MELINFVTMVDLDKILDHILKQEWIGVPTNQKLGTTHLEEGFENWFDEEGWGGYSVIISASDLSITSKLEVNIYFFDSDFNDTDSKTKKFALMENIESIQDWLENQIQKYIKKQGK